jgi:hypothetical protein
MIDLRESTSLWSAGRNAASAPISGGERAAPAGFDVQRASSARWRLTLDRRGQAPAGYNSTMAQADVLTTTDAGLYCPPGDFHVDPWRPVQRAVITHAHADHARPGSQKYLAAAAGREILRTRLGPEAVIETLEYGESLSLNGVKVSLHPAGHVRGTRSKMSSPTAASPRSPATRPTCRARLCTGRSSRRSIWSGRSA